MEAQVESHKTSKIHLDLCLSMEIGGASISSLAATWGSLVRFISWRQKGWMVRLEEIVGKIC